MEKYIETLPRLNQKEQEQSLALPRFTWRGNTERAPFGELNDQIVQEVVKEYPNIGYYDNKNITLPLRSIHNWVQSYGGKVDLTAYLHRRGGGSSYSDSKSASKSDTELDSDLDFDKLGVLLDPKLEHSVIARANTGGGDVILTLPLIYMDHVHFQPWVYNELNNAFLNSICPITGKHH